MQWSGVEWSGVDPNLTFVEWSGTQLNAYFHHLSETAAKHRPRVRPGFKPDGTPDGTLGLSDISGRLSAYNYGLPPTDTEVLKLLMQVIVFYPHACMIVQSHAEPLYAVPNKRLREGSRGGLGNGPGVMDNTVRVLDFDI